MDGAPAAEQPPATRPVGGGAIRAALPATRVFLLVSMVLVLLAGLQLFVFGTETERFFAWTIASPLTAAFLGASYLASVPLTWLGARRRAWVDTRLSIPSIVVFTALTLLVTLVHLDRFHFGEGGSAEVAAWAWIVIYVADPLIWIGVLAAQRRAPGQDPPRTDRLPRAVRAGLALQAGVLVGLGIALLVAPAAVADAWPWPLTPLTGRAIGAWLVGLGVSAALAAREDDRRRVQVAMISWVTLAVLQAAALARFGDQVDWGGAASILYVAFLASIVAVSVGALQPWRPLAPRELPGGQRR